MNNNLENPALERILDLYLERFPLPLRYGFSFSSSEDDSHETFYYELTESELALVRKWYDEEAENFSLMEYLEEVNTEEANALLERVMTHDTPFTLDILDSCDLNDPRYFTRVMTVTIDKNGEKKWTQRVGCEISIDEWRQLMRIYILAENRMSFNQLVYKYPEFAQRAIRHMVNVLCDNVCEYSSEFVAIMAEIEETVEKIMNPQKDVLGLLDTDDAEIAEFRSHYELVPDTEQLCCESTEDGSIYVISSISGRQVRFSQVNWMGDQLQQDGFTCPAEKLLKAWNLTTYDELQKYLKEHYSSRTAFEDLRAFTAQL